MSEASTWQIRRALPNEAADLSEIAMRSKAYWGYSPEFMEACREELSVAQGDIAEPDSVFRLAECEGAIAGYYALVRLPADDCELEALFVEPDWIGRGVGRAHVLLADARGAQCSLRTRARRPAGRFAARGVAGFLARVLDPTTSVPSRPRRA